MAHPGCQRAVGRWRPLCHRPPVTRFFFEHEFVCADAAAFWHCYFDKEHEARLDEALGLQSRELLEETDDGTTHVRRYRVAPKRQIPGWLRAVTRAGLEYEEESIFYKADDRIEISIRPSLLPGRTRVEATYSVALVAPGRVVRRFEGEVEVRMPVIGARLERAVVRDMEASYEVAVPLTQACLDLCA